MPSLAKREVSLRTLGRKVPLHMLPHVQPTFLLQMLIGVSQALNGGAAQTEALARALVLDGQQRLRRLRQAAPHIERSLVHVLKRIYTGDTADEPLSDAENAAHAILEMCLGLMLHWLSKAEGRTYAPASSLRMPHLLFLDALSLSCSSCSHLLFRARSCLIA